MTAASNEASKTPKARRAATSRGATASLAGTVRLPYRPTSFKLSELRRVVANVKRTQG